MNTGATAGFIATCSGGNMRVSPSLPHAAVVAATQTTTARAPNPSPGPRGPTTRARPDSQRARWKRRFSMMAFLAGSFRSTRASSIQISCQEAHAAPLLPFEDERERGVGRLVRDRKLQAIEGAQHAAFHARIVERAVR